MNGYCWKCLENGHRCATDYQDPQTEKFICVFCEDGETCPNWKTGNTQAPIQKEKEMATCKCSPDCPKVPMPGREYAWGHKPKPAALATDAAAAPTRRGRPPKNAAKPQAGKPAQRSRRPVPPTWNNREEGAEEQVKVSLLFSTEQLNRMFAGLPLEDQTACMQMWLDRV